MSEHGSSDNLDVAAELQEKLNQIGIENAQYALRPESHPDFDGENCVDCGLEIPEMRLAQHRIRCVHCQHKKECLIKLRGK